MPTSLTQEPVSVIAGDTVSWTKSLADYKAGAGWVLSYRLINAAGKIDITSSAAGDDHLVSVAAATTATWPPGKYTFAAAVTKGAERYTVGQGEIEIKPDLAAQAAGYDTRTHARKALEAIEAVLESRATSAHLSYSIAGRQVQYIPITELIVLRDKYRREVATEAVAERIAKGLDSGRNIRVRL